MKRMTQSIIFFSVGVLLIVNGCMKRQTTIRSGDSTFREINPFSGVDTSDNATFREGLLSEELAKKAAMVLQPIYFEYNSYQLTAEGLDRLVKIANFLKQNSGIRILIEGHCDERGSSEYNIGLGEQRAQAIRDYLLTYGISKIQLETISLGREVPARSGCFDEQCHSVNRRSELKPLAK